MNTSKNQISIIPITHKAPTNAKIYIASIAKDVLYIHNYCSPYKRPSLIQTYQHNQNMHPIGS